MQTQASGLPSRQPARIRGLSTEDFPTRSPFSRDAAADTLVGSSPLAPSTRDALFREFAPLVRRLLNQYGTDIESRRDLIGEIYWRFCRIVDAFDPRRGVPFRAYVVRQLTASTHTYARTRWRRSGREVRLDTGSSSLSWEPAFDPTPQWDHDLAAEQARQFIPAAISQLPSRQRQALVWRFYDERSYEEIAEMMGVQQATVRSLLRHGVAKLRRYAQEHGLSAD